jgi:hypothetical protein
MINDKKLQDLMAEAVKVRQNEIMEKINRRMEKMYQEKKKQLTIQALAPQRFTTYKSYMEKKSGYVRRVSDMQYIGDLKDGKLAFSKRAAGVKDSEELLERAMSEETEERPESASSSEEGSQGKSKRVGAGAVDEDAGDQVIHEGTDMVGPDGNIATNICNPNHG